VSVQPPTMSPSGPSSSQVIQQPPKEEKTTPAREEPAKSPEPRLPTVAIRKPALVRARIPVLGSKTYTREFGTDAKLVLSLRDPQKTGEGKCAEILIVEAAGTRAIPAPVIHLKFDRGIEAIRVKYGAGGPPPGVREIMRPDKTEYIFRATQFAPGFKMQLTPVHSTEFNILGLKVNGKPMF